ncbi:MAG: FAD-dependent oxidoreductase, partial [Verrucomicrobia bacterium]|nr:FAD-dependent oxidoreductase [Verrucomicrobiota bacterium]
MKLVVVGGVAAGMSCAARTRRLDEHAEIVVLERGEHVSFANCGLPYHIGGTIQERDRLLLQTPASLRRMLGLDVRVGHEVLSISREAKAVTVRDLATGDTYEEAYDKLVLAPGAAPIRPNLPGIDDPRILVLRNVSDMDRIQTVLDAGAKSAVVIGGGYIGIEMAENLKERGLEVDLVEMADQLMTPLDPEMTRPLEAHARWHGVRLHLGAAAAAFTATDDKQLRVELVDGEMLTADLVIMAAGVKPESQLARDAGLDVGERGGIRVDQHLCTSDPDIYAGGDAVEVTDHVMQTPAQIPLAGPANRHGRTIADNLCGGDSIYTTTKGTAIVKVFEMTGGATGTTEKRLKAAGRRYEKLYIHPSGHAGYYPGTATMHVKVLFDPDTGRLLGAQVVGYDGVDKRIDVFATALTAGMTIQDLQHLELSYAPPYGSAKDPVNMAGFVGSNMMAGLVDVWHAEDYPGQTNAGQIIDVRSKAEYESWHIPGARLLPLGSLRDSLDQIDKAKPVFVYCKVGFRSYLAQRLLKQNGFDVRTLSGGSMTFCHTHRTGVCPVSPEAPVVSYAEDKSSCQTEATGRRVDLDLRGLQCPGPIRQLAAALNSARTGDEVCAVASDPGFATDMPLWCRSSGHTLVSVTPRGAETEAIIRKGAPLAANASLTNTKQKTMVVFSGDLDKVLAAFIIANGAISMGNKMTLFFTFWGLNALRKTAPQAGGKAFLDRMFGMMMPKGARRLKLSSLNMLGAGTAMMKHVMRTKNVDSLPSLMQQAMDSGVKIVACAMSMEVMGIKREELIDGIEIG